MRVVLDSNIFFSSLISRVGAPARIVDAWLDGSFGLVTCEQQMQELRRLSRHSKFSSYFFPHEIGRLINEMKPYIHSGPIPRQHTCDDPDDAYLLDLADISQVDFLITGDHRAGLLARKRIGRASILTAKVFADRFSL